MKLDINIRIFLIALFFSLLASAFNAKVSHAQVPTVTVANNNALCAGNPVSGGIFTQIDAGGSCEFQPDVQKINFYKLELCTEAPIGPTTSVITDNSKCVTFYQNDGGSFVTVKRNAGTQIGKAEDYSSVPHGTYTHGVVTMGAIFKFKTTVTFDAAMLDNGGVNGTTTCVTKTSALGKIYGRQENLQTFESGNVSCLSGAVAEEIELAVNTLTTGPNDNDCNHLINFTGTSGVVAAYLLESNMTLVDGVGDVDTDQIKDGTTGCKPNVDNGVARLLGIMEYETPIVIGPSTAGLQIKYNNLRGMAIDMNSSTDHKFWKWDMSFFDFTLTAKKSRARGAWR
jgi:hypothetical protein